VTTDADTLALLCVTHRSLVFRTCRQILGNDEDAEDATQEVFVRVAKYLPGKSVEKPSAYLRQVAQNTARDFLQRKLRALETTPLVEDMVPAQPTSDEAEERLTLLAAEQLAERMRPFLTTRQYKRLRTRIAEGAGRISGQEAADVLHMKQSSLHATDAHMSEVLTEAAVAARMTGEPSCDFVARLVHDEAPSRSMWKKVEAHIETCQQCAERKSREQRRVHQALHTIPGIFLVPTKATAFAVKKAVIAAGVGAAACLTIAVVDTTPFATDLPPANNAAPAPTTLSVVAGPPTSAVASTSRTSTPAVESPAKQAEVPSPRQPSGNKPAAPAPAPVVSQAPAPRDDMPLTISAGSIDNRTITTNGCPGPTTSTVRADITPADRVVLARLGTQVDGKAEATPMRNTGGSTWTGTVGPFPAKTDGGPIRVAVVAVDRGGNLATRYVGSIMLVPCGR
jgi:RNA polymerase sigma factor (sigma-70 family)